MNPQRRDSLWSHSIVLDDTRVVRYASRMTAARTPWKWLKLAGLLMGIGVGVAFAHTHGLSVSDLTPDRVRAYVLSFGWWAPLIFFVLYAQPVVPVPASIMWMAAGLAFGIVGGLLLVLVTTTLRACGQFLLAKRFGREAMEALLKGRLATWERQLGTHAFSAVLWIRLIPNIPYDIQNIGLGLSRVALGPFALATFLGLLPWAMMWVYLGHSMTEATSLWKILLVLMGLAACWALQRRARSRRMRAPA